MRNQYIAVQYFQYKRKRNINKNNACLCKGLNWKRQNTEKVHILQIISDFELHLPMTTHTKQNNGLISQYGNIDFAV